ncbi:dihydrofolate reductase [Corticibacterium sp. UT-5YL-CI-8]|nr:dihydrofolate reductase [Tianweitania sp. UT-5YL-CI-8]
MTKTAIYVAIAKNGVIGRDKGLPWKLSTDLKRFKAGTMGKPMVMGRKTFESIGRPLPGRRNIVITRNPEFHADGIETAATLDEALRRADAGSGVDEICIIGGGEIYRQVLPVTDLLYVTHVLADVEGDTFFPAIDPDIWEVIESEDVPAGATDSHATRYNVYQRRLNAHSNNL